MMRWLTTCSLGTDDLRVNPRAAEREAQLAARSAVRAAPSHGVSANSYTQLDAAKAASLPGTGRALTPAERSGFETTLGHDFSAVRIHTGRDAAQAADEASAKAFTRGNHVVFGSSQFNPASPSAREIIAHELTHTIQQEKSGADAVTQRQAKEPAPEEHGIGAKPPDEPVAMAKGVSPEDTFVLFDQDKAAVSSDAEKKLEKLAKQYQKPVVVEVHGYASSEGGVDYNSNLSGHRAVRVKNFLLSALPAGSEVRLFAHGDTAAFGARPSNRRAGIHVVPGETPKPAEPKPVSEKDEMWHLRIFGRPDAPLADPLGVLQPGLTKPLIIPDFTLQPEPLIRARGLLPALPITKEPKIDWFSIREPFTVHGLTLGNRDIAQIEKNWTYSYNFLLRLGLPPDLAAWGANHGMAYAYDKQLSLELPNRTDIFESDVDKAKALSGKKEFKTPIIPLTGAIEWATKKLFNKDVSFEF